MSFLRINLYTLMLQKRQQFIQNGGDKENVELVGV